MKKSRGMWRRLRPGTGREVGSHPRGCGLFTWERVWVLTEEGEWEVNCEEGERESSQKRLVGAGL